MVERPLLRSSSTIILHMVVSTAAFFLTSVKLQSSRHSVLAELLISNILKRKLTKISNVHEGFKTIKYRLFSKRVLVLFDVVD